MSSTNILILILIFALIILYFWYASIISKNNKVKEAFSDIDVQLKKRSDLIPNILEIAKKFMTHEKTLFEEIVKLRTDVMKLSETGASKLTERLAAEKLLDGKMSNLLVNVENYPDLKSNQTMIEAQRAYVDVEEYISAARRSYNAAVTDLLNAIQIFPGNIIAGYIGVEKMPFFEMDEKSRKVINAKDIL